MKLLFDFFPVLLFFISFKLFGIYSATIVAIIASFLQVSLHWLSHRKFEKMHVITFLMLIILGSLTLFFRNPLFIKWKPTVIYWLTSVIFLGSHYIGNKPLIKKMMEKNIKLPELIWKRLNIAWAIFFLIMGTINIYIAYHYNTNTWVNFKFFGGLGLTLLFVLLQSVYLSRHFIEVKNKSLANSEKG